MTRYWISLLVSLAGFVFAVLLTGQSFMPLMDLPSFINVGLVPFLFVYVLFGFREMEAVYSKNLRRHSGNRKLQATGKKEEKLIYLKMACTEAILTV